MPASLEAVSRVKRLAWLARWGLRSDQVPSLDQHPRHGRHLLHDGPPCGAPTRTAEQRGVVIMIDQQQVLLATAGLLCICGAVASALARQGAFPVISALPMQAVWRRGHLQLA